MDIGWGSESFGECCIGTAGNASAGGLVSPAPAAPAAAVLVSTPQRSPDGQVVPLVPLVLLLTLLMSVSGKDDLLLCCSPGLEPATLLAFSLRKYFA